MAAVSNLCSRAIVLQKGGLQFYGETQDAIQCYTSLARQRDRAENEDISTFRPSWASPYITGCRTLGMTGDEQSCFPLGSDVSFEMTFSTGNLPPLRSPVMGVVINHSIFGTVGGVNTRMTDFEVEEGQHTSGTMRCTVKRLPYLQGRYTADVWLGDGMVDIDVVNSYASFDIEDADVYQSGKVPIAHIGVTFLEAEWKYTAN
jgi:lipopolysaccharide transport system ATP-binding protein